MDRTCPECGDKIIGRADKKYCSSSCRNARNNSQNKDSKNMMRNINNRLRKNYRILEKLNPEEKTKTTKAKLNACLLYTSPSPRDGLLSRMPSSA